MSIYKDINWFEWNKTLTDITSANKVFFDYVLKSIKPSTISNLVPPPIELDLEQFDLTKAGKFKEFYKRYLRFSIVYERYYYIESLREIADTEILILAKDFAEFLVENKFTSFETIFGKPILITELSRLINILDSNIDFRAN